MKHLNLNTSYKHHLLASTLISFWVVLFLILIAPFDIAELSISARLEIMPFYGVIVFISYIILIPIQNWMYQKTKKWTLFFEFLFLLFFNILALMGSYFYYKSNIINGEYLFVDFSIKVYSPIFFVLLVVLIFSRWFLTKKATNTSEEQHIILKGDNKTDFLQIKLSDLIYISSADNYVEVSYLKGTLLQKKLLRNTLKNLQMEFSELIKVHRSYLINPSHFKHWKNATTLVLTHVEVPISKNYKQAILNLKNSSQKTDTSSQTL